MPSPRQKELGKNLVSAFRERLKKDNMRVRVTVDPSYNSLNVLSPSYEETFSETTKQHILHLAHEAGMTGVRGTALNPKGTAGPNQITLYFDTKPVDPNIVLTAAQQKSNMLYPDVGILSPGKLRTSTDHDFIMSHMAQNETLKTAFSKHPAVNAKVSLTYTTRGFVPAGSVARWDEGKYRVTWSDRSGSTQGRSFSDSPEGEEKARAYFKNIIDAEVTGSLILEARRSRRKKKNRSPTLAEKTGIVPDVIAAQVADAVFANHPDLIPRAKSLIAFLSSKAEAANNANSDFGDHLKGKDGREGLKQSMQAWAKEYVLKHGKKTVEAAARISDFTVGTVYHQEYENGDRSYFKAESKNKNGSWKGRVVESRRLKKSTQASVPVEGLKWVETPKDNIPHILTSSIHDLIAAARKPKVVRGERRYVIVTDPRTKKEYRVLTSVAGSGFPVIVEIPSNKHRAGAHRGMLMIHDDIVKAEVYMSQDDFAKSFRAQTKLQIEQGLPEKERAKFYKATVREITASNEEKPMSAITSLIADFTIEAKAKKSVSRAKGSSAPKPKMAAGKPPTVKSSAGLEAKLKTLAKKFPGVTFTIKELKTKKNVIVVRGIAKMAVARFAELARAIPNTSHVPQSLKKGVAIFTLFGKKEITGVAAPKKARPYFIAVGRTKGSNDKWAIEFGDYDRKVVVQEIADLKNSNKYADKDDKMEYKLVPLPDSKQKTATEAVKLLAFAHCAAPIPSRTAKPPVTKAVVAQTSIGRFAIQQSTTVDTIEAAITNPDMINNQIIHKIAHAAHKAPGGYITVTDLKKSLPLLTAESINTALTKMHLDQVIQLVSGSDMDTDTVTVGKEKFNRIYPMDSMMQILSDESLHSARKALKVAKKKVDDDPSEPNAALHKKARKIFAQVLKRIQTRPAVPYAGPPKASKSAKILASTEMFIVKMRNEDGNYYYGKSGMTMMREALATPLDKDQAGAIVKQYRRSGENQVTMLPVKGPIKTPEIKRGDQVSISVSRKNGKLIQDTDGEEWFGTVVGIKDGRARVVFEPDFGDDEVKDGDFVVAPVGNLTLSAADVKPFRISAVSQDQHYALMQSVAKRTRAAEVADLVKKKLPPAHHTKIESCLSPYFKYDKSQRDARRYTNGELADRVVKDIKKAA